MKGNPQVESLLNGLLRQHLIAKDCYRKERAIFRQRGYRRLADEIDAVKEVHDSAARKLLRRLLFLEFDPEIDHPFPNTTADLRVFLQNGQIFESQLVQQISAAVSDTRGSGDEVSHHLLAKIAAKVEHNVQWFEIELKRLGDVGQELFLAHYF